MPKEVTIAREKNVMGLRSRNAISGRTDRAHGRATYPAQNKVARVPRSDRGFYGDSISTVYDRSGKVVERGIWDESVYQGERVRWNERDGNYDLLHGYKLVFKD